MTEALFEGIDCLLLKVPDLEAGLSFYRDQLGQELVWRTPIAVGLRLPGGAAELVLHTQHGPETDLFVADVDAAFHRFISAGGAAIEPPFDIPIGRCAVVRDPFGNTLTILDQTKGDFVVDEGGQVIGVRSPPGS